MTPGFLVELIPILLTMKQKDPDSIWSRLQIQVNQEIKPMATTLIDARDKIKAIALERYTEHSENQSKFPLLPLIFLDEFNCKLDTKNMRIIVLYSL